MELYLLTAVSDETDARPDAVLSIGGRAWACAGPFSTTDPASVPKFACISYVWGTTREKHPLQGGRQISGQTLPALAAAIKSTSVSAFWLDVFCIPVTEPARSTTLESMGYIYSIAEEVIVALAADRSLALEEMLQKDQLSNPALLALEDDEWVQSVWTYQEVVNSQTLQLTCTDPNSTAVVDGSTFLNRVGFSLDRYKTAHGFTSFEMRVRTPKLDAFEDLIADWMISAYTERSCLQVMSNLDRRVAVRPENYYYSMIGSITQKPAARTEGVAVADLVRKVMSVCEEKNDYSFIFSSTPRGTGPNQFWRPRPERLRPLLSFFSHGSRQRGRHDAQGLWLEDMVCLDHNTSSPEPVALLELLRKLPIGVQKFPDNLDDVLHTYIPGFLALAGFTGSKAHIKTTSGVFYPQEALREDILDLVVATEIHWTFGNPGIAITKRVEGPLCVPGVFVGAVDKGSRADYLLEEL